MQLTKLPAIAPLVALVMIASVSVTTAQQPSAPPMKAADKKPAKKLTPVPVSADMVKLEPQTTAVEFVGLHTGDDPKPRLGGFKEFEGVLLVEEGKLQKISVQFEIGSIWTEFDKLTSHLQAADFFNVAEYPTATFKSTKITAADAKGKVQITGVLKMHGTEGEITFPATVKITDKGLTLTSEFKLDRTAFGMTDHIDGVEAMVSVAVKVGQPTKGADKEEPKTKPAAETNKAAAVDAPESGLAVGQSVEPWTPVHVAGPDKGTKTCPVCTYLAKPAIVVFAKDGPNTEQLLSEVEQLLAEHDEQGLKGFVAVLDAPAGELEAMATAHGIALTSVCCPDANTGRKDLAAYQVNPKVDNTVMIYKDYKVVANWVDLNAQDAAQLRSAVEKMVD